MIVALTIIAGFLATALVAVVALVLAASSRDRKINMDERATMLRAIIARNLTETLPPGAELRAHRELEREATRRATAGPLVGSASEMDEMEEARKIRHGRAYAEGLVDAGGNDIVPTGF